MYNKAWICRTANDLVKQGYNRSDAFVEAWAIEKERVARSSSKAEEKTVTVVEEPAASTPAIELLEEVRKYRELQKMIEELEAQAEAVKGIIVGEMEMQQTEELKVDIFKVRYKTVISNRFNTKEFKKEHSDLYSQYVKQSECKRFTIA